VNGLRFGGNTWVTPATPVQSGGADGTELYDGVSPLFNDEVANFAQLFFLGDAIPAQNSDSFKPQLAVASPLWGFNSAILSGITDIQDLSTDNQRININKLPYQGAFGVANWAASWTYLSEAAFFPGENTGGSSMADADGDGISDTLEATPALLALGFSASVNNVTTHGGVAGTNLFSSIYTAASILNLRTTAGVTVQKTNAATNNVTLTVPVQKSTDLDTWEDAGVMTLPAFTGAAGKEFYRLEVQDAN
jgi:hypothetical protein